VGPPHPLEVRSATTLGLMRRPPITAPPYNRGVAARSVLAPASRRADRAGSWGGGADKDAVIVVEGLSKRYPRTPVTIFPPVVSMFHRNWFTRRRSSSGSEAQSTDAETASRPPGVSPAGGRATASTARRRPTDWDLEADELDDDEEDEEDDDDEGPAERVGGPTPDSPGEMFWALRDISFQVPRGAALGVLGGPDAGKTTLLQILGGRAFPTEGRVLVREPVSPLPDALARALSATGKGTHKFSLRMAANLMGVGGHLTKRHKDEIEEFAQPVLGDDGEPLPGAMVRLAVATALVLPTNAILLDELKGVDEAFMQRVVERLRQRLRRGTSLVLASRQPELVQELCDEAIRLESGSVTSHGDVSAVIGSAPDAAAGGQKGTSRIAGGVRRQTPAPTRQLSQGRELDIPAVVPPFNQWAALLSAELRTSSRRAKRVDTTTDEVTVEIRFETAVPDLEAHCGVVFTPRDGDGTGIRLEFSEPLRFADPGTYVLVARPDPRTLRIGAYDVRADAVISDPEEGRATVIARQIGRVRIHGDESPDPAESPITHWDGRELWLVEAEWSIR
jgi:ABC-type polysaccharide/polyol phosphate transport system ATPase subunit